MRWAEKLSDNIKRGIRSWLDIQPSGGTNIRINEVMDFELHAIRNRIWYRGDSNELEQLYQQSAEYADKYKFWASRCTPGMEMRKIHTGLPSLIVRVLAGIVLADMNDFDFKESKHGLIWKEIESKNKFRKKINKCLRDALYIGDGAWKVTLNTQKSQYPILRWYPGERVELIYDADELTEIVFKTPYTENRRQYILYEHYGYGYVRNELYYGNEPVGLNTIKATENLSDYNFDKSLIMAVPLMIYESAKFDGRGGSIFDGKLDSFDAYDEAWSQWMDALRAGRARTYIPESYIPRDPETGNLLRPNPFDNRFIAGDDNMSENGKNVISTEQPAIPHDSYTASYCTALDQCLQGIISPSTLGIDVKKLDNAEAQREKEKATLYTRNDVIEALQECLPEVVTVCINAYYVLQKQAVEDIQVEIPFGEYANPSFESQVETLSKARPGSAIMSIEAQVEEMWGDNKDMTWKAEEIKRLKAEQGIASLEEPGLNLEGVNIDVGENNGPVLPKEPEGAPGTDGAGE